MKKLTTIEIKELKELNALNQTITKLPQLRQDLLCSESLKVAKALAKLNQDTLLFQWYNNLIALDVIIEKILEIDKNNKEVSKGNW